LTQDNAIQINAIQIDTLWGYKSFEIYQGDITKLEFFVDLLIVSVSPYSYTPVEGTVIGSLFENHNIELEEFREQSEFDLRNPFNCWISKEIANPKIRRLLCLEMHRKSRSTEHEIKDLIENIFVALSILESKEIVVKTIALPLLGTGVMSFDVNLVIKYLLDYSLKHLQRSQYLDRVVLVAFEKEKAKILDNAMNQVLHRVKLVLPRKEYMNKIKSEFLGAIDNINLLIDDSQAQLFTDLKRIVIDTECRSFELGIIARKLVEFIAEDILKHNKGALYYKIEDIRSSSNPKIAEWIPLYMHVLRVFGNESAHEIGVVDRIPTVVSESDLEICLFCICRLLNFWIDFRNKSSA